MILQMNPKDFPGAINTNIQMARHNGTKDIWLIPQSQIVHADPANKPKDFTDFPDGNPHLSIPQIQENMSPMDKTIPNNFDLPINPAEFSNAVDVSIKMDLPIRPQETSLVSKTQTIQLDLPRNPKNFQAQQNINILHNLPVQPSRESGSLNDLDYLELPVSPATPVLLSESSIDLDPPSNPSLKSEVKDTILLLDPPPTKENASNKSLGQDLPLNPSNSSNDFDYDGEDDHPKGVALKDEAYDYNLPFLTNPTLIPSDIVTDIQDETETFDYILGTKNAEDEERITTTPSSLRELTNRDGVEALMEGAKKEQNIAGVTAELPFVTTPKPESVTTFEDIDLIITTERFPSANDLSSIIHTVRPEYDNELIVTEPQTTTIRTISNVEGMGKEMLMSKILEALGDSIHHPMKEQVLQKLKNEFAPSSSEENLSLTPIGGQQILSMPESVRISKELKVNNTFSSLGEQIVEQIPQDIESDLDEEFDPMIVHDDDSLDDAIKNARVVLFNRLREGVNVEDAIRVSLQPHLVNVIQPHVAKEVENRIHYTYKDQIFVGKDYWVDDHLPLSAIPNSETYFDETTTTHELDESSLSPIETTEQTLEFTTIPSSTPKRENIIIVPTEQTLEFTTIPSSTPKQENVFIVQGEMLDTANLINSEKQLSSDPVKSIESGFTLETVRNSDPFVPFFAKVNPKKARQQISQRLFADNVSQSPKLDLNEVKDNDEIETFRGVSVIQIPSPQHQQKTEAAIVNLPKFQEISNLSNENENFESTKTVFLNEKDRKSKITILQNSFPRVKSDRLKLLRNRFRNKDSGKAKEKKTKFKDKREKDKAINFILKTIREQRKQLKSASELKIISKSSTIAPSTTSTSRSMVTSTIAANEIPRTTTINANESEEQTYFPIETTETPIFNESTYFPDLVLSSTTSAIPLEVSEKITESPVTSISSTDAFESSITSKSPSVMIDTATSLPKTIPPSQNFPTLSTQDTPASSQNIKSGSVENIITKPSRGGVEEDSESFNLISFEGLKSTTVRSTTMSQNGFSEPLEIIRSSVIVSQNHRNADSKIDRAFPQLLGNSIVRSSKSFNEGKEATTHESVVGDLDENITTTEETVDLFK